MAILTSYKFKGWAFTAYLALHTFDVTKHGEENYVVNTELYVYKDSTKEVLIEVIPFSWSLPNITGLTIDDIWKFIKRTYPGQDVLD